MGSAKGEWRWGLSAVILLFTLASCGPILAGPGSERNAVSGYRVLHDIPLPGGTSRWDYQVIDRAAQRLYIAHLGASQVVVFDTRRNRVTGVVKGVEDVHGMTLVPALGRLYASATGKNRLVAIDTTTLETVGTAPTGPYPDGVAYAANAGTLFVSDEQGSGDTVLDARTVQHLDEVDLGRDIGNSQYDPATGLVYVAVGSSNRLLAVDPHTLAVVHQIRLPRCQGAHGVQIDHSGAHRAFVACEGNARLLAVDLRTGHTDGTFDVGDGPDVLALDSSTHRLYVASESGQLAIFNVAARARKLTQGYAGPNAHSVAVDTGTHVIYLPLTDVGGHSALRELVAA